MSLNKLTARYYTKDDRPGGNKTRFETMPPANRMRQGTVALDFFRGNAATAGSHSPFHL